MVRYEDIKFDPLPDRSCIICDSPVKICWGAAPRYDVICSEEHITEIIWHLCPRCGSEVNIGSNNMECRKCGWSVNW